MTYSDRIGRATADSQAAAKEADDAKEPKTKTEKPKASSESKTESKKEES